MLAIQHPGLAQADGILYGQVLDADLGDPLGFAAVGISALNIGTNTDIDGVYRLTNIPAGTYLITFTYLGYRTEEREITISANQELELTVQLQPEGIRMEEVVVTGQAEGQQAAINQQINSNTIVNVVSKEKLQELPDQNAAESVGRLPGVSVYRDAGEGQRISVRGISPRLNSITINGQRLPSTEESDRSVDLSMISPDMLAGIELFKAITPDMDGDAVGGTVNFSIRKADRGFRTLARVLGGYNGLKNDFGQFRTNLSLSNRFVNNKLGVIVTGNFQRANRSNEFINSSYEQIGSDPETGEPVMVVQDLNLGDKLETRYRYGGSLTLDYTFNQDHTLLFSSNYGRTDRDQLRYRRRYRVSNNAQEFDIWKTESHTTLLANTLSGNHHFGKLELDWMTSYSFSDQRTPYQLSGRFRELSAMKGAVPDNNDLTTVPLAFRNNLENTIMYDTRFRTSDVDEDHFTAQLDLKYNYKLSKQLNGFLKVGGKYRRIERARDNTEVLMRPYLDGDNPAQDNPELFLRTPSKNILLANFIGDYTNSQFFDGRFDIIPGTEALRDTFSTSVEAVNVGAHNDLFGTNYALGDEVFYRGHLSMDKVERFYNYFRDDYSIDGQIDLEDYDALENIAAAYVMAELNIGRRLTLLGGLRMEDTRQNYSSRSGSPLEEEEGGTGFIKTIDVNAAQGYTDWLPMAHVKFKPTSWMDMRAAVTKTLARPNFFNLVPWERINNSEQSINRGKPDLNHTTAWNYDLFLSFYNKFGLLTLGGFFKQLDNIDYIRNSIIVDPTSRFNGYALTEPANIQGTSTVRGLEFDLQMNLRPLQGFWRGIVFSANLTLARSETFYPVFSVQTIPNPAPPPFFITEVIDTFRNGPIVGQADIITNVTLGYEIGGFSGRISMIYQSDALSPGNPGIGSSGTGVGIVRELDFYDASFTRFDLAFKQRLDRQGQWNLLLNVNNLTNTPEQAFLGVNNRLVEDEVFGLTAEFGVMWKLSK